MMGPTSQRVTIDGADVFVGQGGAPWQEGRPTLVLMHGAGMDRTVWILLARYFARHGCNVVTPDLPGHGASLGSPLPTIDEQGTWLGRLLETLAKNANLDTTTLLLAGHSMGSLTALALARDRVQAGLPLAGLIMLGTAWPMSVGDALLSAAQANDVAAIDMITVFGHSHSSQLGHNPVAGIHVAHLARAILGRAAKGVLHTDLHACHQWAAGGAAAETVGASDSSCHLIIGDADRMTPRRAASGLIDRLQAKSSILDNCGHMMMSEQPEATLQALLQAVADCTQE